jgi:hypothetical protein
VTLVNWLTDRLIELGSLGGFTGFALPWRDDLKTVNAPAIIEELGRLDVASVDTGALDVNDCFLLLRQSEAEWDIEEVPPPDSSASPEDFTVGLEDAGGIVVYLPDDADEHLPALQLYRFENGWVRRVVATGEFEGTEARLLSWRDPAPLRGVCSEGPCSPPTCVGGCKCRRWDGSAVIGPGRRSLFRWPRWPRATPPTAWIRSCVRF